MLFLVFSTFSSRGHFVKWSRSILAIPMNGSPKEYFFEIILKSDHSLRTGRHLNDFFLFLSLAAILFSGAELF